MNQRPLTRADHDPDTAGGVIRLDDPGLDDLRFAVLARIRPALVGLDDVGCQLDRHGSDVVVRLTGPPISEMRRHAIGVRVLDAVRSVGRTFGHVDVVYDTDADDRDP